MSVSVSRSVVPDSLRPHGLQPTRLHLSMRFSRQGYWSGLPFPSLGDLPNPGIVPPSKFDRSNHPNPCSPRLPDALFLLLRMFILLLFLCCRALGGGGGVHEMEVTT